VYGLQMYAIRRAQGRLAEVAPVLRAVTTMADPPPMWRPGLAAIYAELDMLDEAAQVFDRLAPHEFAVVPRDAVWPACLTFLAETCIALGDTERAPVLSAALVPYHRRNLMAGMTICFGPADRLLGGLAALSGRRVDAEAHFTDALALAEASRSPLWTAEVQYDFARFLASGGQQARAAVLGRAAISTARQFGIGRLAGRPVPGEAAPAGRPEPARADQLSEREVEVLALAAAGRSNREIGQRLFISPNTVANHMRAILRKTGTANRAEAASYATRQGLTQPAS
jgi:DNA-binding CsgD family transcriptional regulator